MLGNTTVFTSLHLTSATQNEGIWGSASTSICSVLFGLTTDGYSQLRSKEIAGDVHSLAWGSNGRNLHALDSHSSSAAATSIVNYRISEDPTLEDIVSTDILANVSDASQIAVHPSSNRMYVVTKDTNDLITVALEQDTNTTTVAQVPSRYRILPSSLDSSKFHTSSLAITASKNTLWTFSQSTKQAVITVFTLNTTTGEIIDVAARASWSGAGEGQITAAPFENGDVVAITNSPVGYVTLLGLDQGSSTSAQDSGITVGHGYLQQLEERDDPTRMMAQTVTKVKSYGRTVLDEFIAMGESVWVD
jgi:DNA-binding beta-propeller fold protein YncE